MYNVRIPLRLRRLCSPPQTRPHAVHNTIFWPRRCVHTLPDWPYDVEEGLGEFLSPAALQMLAVEYQEGLLERLNEQVRGTEMENQSVTQTVISTASHRSHALAFNYASQALNNSFFLQYLKPPPPGKDSNEELIDPNLGHDIKLHFGSLAQLKSTFSAAALGMINSGWVWLVSDERGSMQVVATFGAGTLLVRSRHHMLEEDMEKPILGQPEAPVYKRPPSKKSSRSMAVGSSPRPWSQQTTHGSSPLAHGGLSGSSLSRYSNLYTRPDPFSESSASAALGSAAQKDDVDACGDILTPLLCVSVYEHAWVGAGYGIWGKEEYLKRFWTVVNWEAVGLAYTKATRY